MKLITALLDAVVWRVLESRPFERLCEWAFADTDRKDAA